MIRFSSLALLSARTLLVGLSVLLAVSTSTAVAIAYLKRGPSEDTIASGRMIFEHEYVENDALCAGGDGLGPVFNERSCVACHFLGGVGGAGTNKFNVTAFEAFPVPGRTEIIGSAVHTYAVSSRFQESVDIVSTMFPLITSSTPSSSNAEDGCSSIGFPVTTEFDPVQLEEINTPALFGAGIIDDLSNSAIALNAAKSALSKAAKELEGDFSGRGVGRLRTRSFGRPGKFGWKGQFATLEEFIASACAMELGLTNPKVAQPVPNEFRQDETAKLDMTQRQLYQLVSFVKSLPAPVQVLPADPKVRVAVQQGELLFEKVGCAECHVPNLGGVDGIYTDFQLYEVEHEEVADDYVEPDFDPDFTLPVAHPRPSEWQTPPLWGVADSAPYFHDGGSPTLISAIKRHGRDARFSRQRFEKLDTAEQKQLLAFLQSLRAPQNDTDLP